jgi:uroporphyrinogen decarboxylase
VWETTDDGITGAVTGNPLADWEAFEEYAAPDPEKTDGRYSVNWEELGQRFREDRTAGRIARAELPHGHTFLLLSYLRGLENLTYDMADDNGHLDELLAMVESFNVAVIERFVERGATWVGYPEDLGMQCGPLLMPDHFRKYIKPIYERMTAPARDAGCVIHMHSDGDIRALIGDLTAVGMEVINLQDLVNGIDWIRENLTGQVCVDLDIDRQQVTRFGTPAEIDALIREEIEKLGSREGGLMLTFGLYPGTPLENVSALMDSLVRYAAYYS